MTNFQVINEVKKSKTALPATPPSASASLPKILRPMLLYGLPEQDPSWSDFPSGAHITTVMLGVLSQFYFEDLQVQIDSCWILLNPVQLTFLMAKIPEDIWRCFPWFQSSSTDSSWACYICIIICARGFIWINESIQTHGGFLRWDPKTMGFNAVSILDWSNFGWFGGTPISGNLHTFLLVVCVFVCVTPGRYNSSPG